MTSETCVQSGAPAAAVQAPAPAAESSKLKLKIKVGGDKAVPSNPPASVQQALQTPQVADPIQTCQFTVMDICFCHAAGIKMICLLGHKVIRIWFLWHVLPVLKPSFTRLKYNQVMRLVSLCNAWSAIHV